VLCRLCNGNNLQVIEFFASMKSVMLPRPKVAGLLPGYVRLVPMLVKRCGDALLRRMAAMWCSNRHRKGDPEQIPQASDVPLQELLDQLDRALSTLAKFYQLQQRFVVDISRKASTDGSKVVVCVVVTARWVQAEEVPMWTHKVEAAHKAQPRQGVDSCLDVDATAELREAKGQLYLPVPPANVLEDKKQVRIAYFESRCGTFKQLQQLARAVTAYVPMQVAPDGQVDQAPTATGRQEYEAAVQAQKAAVAAVEAMGKESANPADPYARMVDLGLHLHHWQPLVKAEVPLHTELLRAL
jgi:hypothetical protein